MPVGGERGVLVEVVPDVGAATLDEVAGQQFPAAGLIEVKIVQGRVEQAEQVAEGLVLAAVRGSRDEDQVPGGVLREGTDQVVTLAASPAAGAAVGDAGVRFVDDDQVGAGAQELAAAPVGLDEVGRHHREREAFEDRFAADALALQPPHRARQDEFGLKPELVAQFAGPLLGQRRGAEHGECSGLAEGEQLGRDQAGLDGLADADVVGDQ